MNIDRLFKIDLILT